MFPFVNDRRNVEIINNNFKKCSDFCLVTEISGEDNIPPNDIQVTLEQCGEKVRRYTVDEQIQILRDACKKLIEQFPWCKFSFHYLFSNKKVIILEHQPIQEHRKSHPFYERPKEMYYRGLPKRKKGKKGDGSIYLQF